jgi:hypothetical protein
MTNLFSFDDLGVLTESLGRVPDDALLFDLVETAREVAGERYNRACISHDRDMESWRAGMETHTLRMAQWSRAVEQHAAAMRDHAVTLEGWGLDPTLYPKPVPPEGPGPAPQYGEPPVAPVAPTDADAVAMLMAEQRAAVARARLEPKWEPVINMEIERAEIVNEAFDLVMARLGSAPVAPEPEAAPEHHFADLMLADETIDDARARLSARLKELRHYLIAPEIKVNEDGSVGLTVGEQAELQDLERRQTLGRWLEA